MKRLVAIAILCSGPLLGFTQDEGPAIVATDAGFGFLVSGQLPNLSGGPVHRDADRFVGKRDCWLPFQVTLENKGDSVEGILRVAPTNTPDANPMSYQKRISLPKNAPKRIAFPIFNNWVGSLVVTFEDAAGHLLKINKERTLSLDQPLTIPLAAKTLLVATQSRMPFTNFLRRTRAEGLTTDRILIPIPPEELPQSVVEFAAVDGIVLDDVAVDLLTDAQIGAIQQFVFRGGALVVAMRQHGSQLKRLEAILPAEPGAVENVSTVASLSELGVPCDLPAPQAVTTLVPKPGATAWGPGQPTVVQGRVDHGTVIFCGFAFSETFLSRWDGAPMLVEAILAASEPPLIQDPGGIFQQDLRRQMAGAIRGSIAKSLPPFSTVVTLMVLYLVAILVIPYVAFRSIRRLEWAWAGVFAIAVGGVIAVYGVGTKYLDGQTKAYRVTITEGGTAKGVHERHNFWSVFTSRGERFDLGFDNAPVPFPFGTELALRGTKDRIETLNVAFDEAAQIRGLRTYVQDSVSFETTDWVAPAGDVRFEATDNMGVTGTVSFGKTPVLEAWVAYHGVATPVREGDFSFRTPQPLESTGTMFEKSVRAAILRYMAAAAESLPLLIYRYDAQASLITKGIPEAGFHLGVVRPTRRGSFATNITCQALCTKPFDAANAAAPVEFMILASGVAPTARIDWIHCALTGPGQGGLTPEFFNFDTSKWVPVKKGRADFAAASLYRRFPNNQVWFKCRVRADRASVNQLGDLRERNFDLSVTPSKE